jgi:catechol 2,3-dioxygenase
MTLLPFIHRDSELSERTRNPHLRPMTAEVRSHSRHSRVGSVADPDCIRLDLCRWETEGGALIGDRRPPDPPPSYTANSNLQTESHAVKLNNFTSSNNRLTGRPARQVPTESLDAERLLDENRADVETRWRSAKESAPSMRLGHVHLKVRDLNRSIRFYTSVLDMRLTEHTGRYAFLAIGTEHHSLALEEIGAWAVAPARHAVGLAHVAFEVPNRLAFVAAHDRLLKASIPIICGDKRISWAIRFEDPDGNEIEIYLDRRKALDGTALWERRWRAFKIPKPFCAATVGEAGIGVAKVARHRNPQAAGRRQTEDVLK